VVKAADGLQILLEGRRLLRWNREDTVTVLDASGKSLLQVSLLSSAVRESSAEALGVNVEETDLGGTRGSKRYLDGKKKPSGRSFDAGALAEGTEGGAGQEQKSSVGGIPLSIRQFPSGASLWRFQWPGETEEIFFDKKKTLIHSQTTRETAGLTVTLTQWAEGSFARQYRRGDAGVTVTYDDNDGSTLFEFFNQKGQPIAQLNCREECSAGQ
jgi:hypothetical protein